MDSTVFSNNPLLIKLGPFVREVPTAI